MSNLHVDEYDMELSRVLLFWIESFGIWVSWINIQVFDLYALKKLFPTRSQDFCCEGCGCAMKDVLLPLKSGSDSSQADQEAKELARQISFKVP